MSTRRGSSGEVAAVAGRYRLSLRAVRARGRVGERRGAGPGSALELLDFRDYAPGDDLRHVDWRGYARTDQLRVRVFEAEVAPVVEVLLDTSPSLAVTAAKQATARELAQAFAAWARRDGSAARCLALGGGLVDADAVPCTGPAEPAPPQLPLRPGAVRVLLTDALWPQDPAPVLRRAAAGAARFVCVQVLDPWELSPEPAGATTLVDCERGDRAALHLDARAVAGYRERLLRHNAAVRDAVLGLGGVYVQVAAAPLATVCQRDLLPAGVVEPA